MEGPPPRRRFSLRKLAFSLGAALALAVLALELASRRADRVLAGRAATAGYRPPDQVEDFDLWDRLAYLTLEYGHPKRGLEQTGARMAPHPYLSYAPVPGFRTPPGAAQQASHNALGFRGRETTWEKPAGTYRIVTTGGSSVYGQSESSDAAVWSQQLEDRLQAARPGYRVEVVNLGASGWSSHEMLINLALRGVDLAPDLVLVYEAINDMRCALYTPGGEPQRDNTHWRQAWPTDRPSALERALSASRTYLVFRRYFTDYAAARVDLGYYAIRNYRPVWPAGFDPYRHAGGEPSVRGFANTRRNLRALVALARAHGAQVAFVTQALPRWHLDPHPSRAEQLAGFEHVLAIQRDLARELEVPIFEAGALVEAACEAEVVARIEESARAAPDRPRPEIEAEWRRAGRRDLLFHQEVHPNDRGSELVARTIADLLLASDLMPR